VQQRTLDEYHRQGDEQSLQAARMQQQTTDAIRAIKETAEGETERLRVTVQEEISTVNDSLARARQDIQERMSSAERRLHDAEAGLDSFRARLRAAEAVSQESGHLQRSLDDARQRLQVTEARAQALERHRGEVTSQLQSLEGRVADNNKLGQITQIVLRLEELEKCVLNQRAERDSITRQVRAEMEDKLQAAEARMERQLNALRLASQEQQNVVREMQRDVTRDEVQGRQLLEQLRAVQADMMDVRAQSRSGPDLDATAVTQRLVMMEQGGEEMRELVQGALANLRDELQRSKEDLAAQAAELKRAGEALKAAEKRAADSKRETLKGSESMLSTLWDLEKKFKEMETVTNEGFKDIEESRKKDRLQLSNLDRDYQEMKGYVDDLAAQKDGPVTELRARVRDLGQEMHTELGRVRRILERAGFQRGDSTATLSRELSQPRLRSDSQAGGSPPGQ